MTTQGRIAGIAMNVLEVDGCALRYQLVGQVGAPVVVLSHGATLDHESWLPQAQTLTESCQVLLWDLRGHGRSQPLDGKFTIERGAADLRALLDHLQIERVAVPL